MPQSPELYCSHCQRQVRPLMGVVNYHCPTCGATFMVTQIEQARDACNPHDLKQTVSAGKVAI